MARRVWVVSELYYPEQAATGTCMTAIAEGLATSGQVCALCAQPTYLARGLRAPRDEFRNGVPIRRVASTTLDKNSALGRMINLITVTASLFAECVLRFRRGDRVLVVTNPPTLPILVTLACRLRGADCVLLVHDMYPEALVATGMDVPGGVLTRVLNALNGFMYRRLSHIVVIGRDQEAILRRKLARPPPITLIPNWADVDVVTPAPRAGNRFRREWKAEDHFIVQLAGNIGRVMDVESMAAAAERLLSHPDVLFVFVGAGVKRPWLESAVRERKLTNVLVLSPQPREWLRDLLNAADLALIGLGRGLSGISVPSRLYNALAAGKPILAAAPADSELGRVVAEEHVGWVVTPDDPEAIAAAILEAKSDPARLARMGERARQVVEEKYQLGHALAGFRSILQPDTAVPLD